VDILVYNVIVHYLKEFDFDVFFLEVLPYKLIGLLGDLLGLLLVGLEIGKNIKQIAKVVRHRIVVPIGMQPVVKPLHFGRFLLEEEAVGSQDPAGPNPGTGPPVD
jgi:hypothetical protein